jgi:hypothetical protein
MSYDPTGPYPPPDPNYQWQQPTQPPPPAYPTSGVPGYPTSGSGGYPPPAYGYPPAAPQPPQPPKKNYLPLIIALIAGIVVVGCGGTVAVLAIAGSKPSTHTPSSHAPAAGGGGTAANSGPVPFGAGHSFQWSDKIEASVLSVVRFTPASTAAGTHPGQVGIKVTVKLTNNSTKQLDLTLADVHVKSGANGTQADKIFDSENNLGLGFEGSIAPGHSATADYGFSVPPGDLGNIDVEVAPGFDYDAGIFEGSATG